MRLQKGRQLIAGPLVYDLGPPEGRSAARAVSALCRPAKTADPARRPSHSQVHFFRPVHCGVAERTYLTTSFKEKDQVKALGARWDPAASKWYVPEGKSLEPFAAWLSEALPATTTSSQVSEPTKGVPLSRLLSGVATVIARTFAESVWVAAEVVRASVSRGHYYLELSERSETGEVLAQARAVIWSRYATALVSQFKQATGADLDAGIKVLLRARPVFNAQFGFSLEVDGIDPSYTLGDLEAKKRDIRERLRKEGLFDLNRALSAPWDFAAVLVVAPERGAGLGDFAKEAERLQRHGVCSFSYAHSRFQGEGAAAEIMQALSGALQSWSGSVLPDAIVLIRGGGAVNDLAWLNDYALARYVCECPVPVLAGIGHERDSTSVDEVAHRSFDTPSKVVAGIEETIRGRVQGVRMFKEAVFAKAQTQVAKSTLETRRLIQQVDADARSRLATVAAATERHFQTVRLDSVNTLHEARSSTQGLLQGLRIQAHKVVSDASREAPSLLGEVRLEASKSLSQSRQQTGGQLPLLLSRAAASAKSQRQAIDSTIGLTVERSRRELADASSRSEALMREIAGQGPQKTLRRGFAVVRTQGGNTVTRSHDVAEGAQIEVKVRDGLIEAVVRAVKQTDADDAASSQ